MNPSSTTSYPSIREVIANSPLSAEQVEAIRAAWPQMPGIIRWNRVPEVGLVERSYVVPNGSSWGPGQGGSSVTATIEADGKRLMTRYGDTAARINTYGDSFTHCDQVNDQETWQEYLAAHFQEPIRNFGRGGGSVYEAYLRMRREEATDNAAEYVLFYMWGDDHMRSILGANMTLGLRATGEDIWPSAGFANPYLTIDPDSGEVVECANPLPTPESVSRLADPEWYRTQYEHDLVAQLLLFGGHPGASGTDSGVIATIDEDRIATLAATLGYADEWAVATDRHAAARELLDRYSLRTSIYVIEKARAFAAEHGKKIMFLLLDPFRSVRTSIESGVRYDQAIVDHLASTGADYFDMTQVHVDDFRSRHAEWPEYLWHHYVDGGGHYNPAGNHFFAFSLLPHLLNWLDPKPAPYLGTGASGTDDYLFNGRFGAALDTDVDTARDTALDTDES
jgi:hypothetical protein